MAKRDRAITKILGNIKKPLPIAARETDKQRQF